MTAGREQRKACYLALAIAMDGSREALGLWFQVTLAAKFWMQVLNALRHRGLRDILICCIDGPTGRPEAIQAAFPPPGADLHRAPHPASRSWAASFGWGLLRALALDAASWARRRL